MVYNPAGSLFSLPSRIAIANFESFSLISIANSLCEPSEIKALAEGQKEVCFLIFAQIPVRLRNLRGWSSMAWHLYNKNILRLAL